MNYSIVTIDTEAHFGDDPVDRYVWGNIGGVSHGIPEIMDVLDAYHAKAIFFLDFAECWDYGDEPIRGIAEFIKSRGHEVGVHIHPDHMADKRRLFLWEYSKEEQRAMLEMVTEKYEQLCGKKPLFFRAGKYGANSETLDIISSIGYRFDFSEFYGRDWCGICPPVTADGCCRIGPLFEFPVTSFSVSPLPSINRFDKIDMEMSSKMHSYLVNCFADKNENQVLTLFGHSFSFIGNRFSKDMSKLRYDPKTRAKFESALKQVTESDDFKLLSPDELISLCDDGAFDSNRPNDSPSIVVRNPFISAYYLYSTAWRIKDVNRKAQVLLAASFGFVLALIHFFFCKCS